MTSAPVMARSIRPFFRGRTSLRQTLAVGLILSFVIMMSVLSVPLMINAQSPTMLTADMAFRINAYGDYGVANALGFISYLMTGAVAWIYLRQGVRERSA